MQKVVAFLEKYAEWVAIGFAGLFLLFIVYSYVLSPDALRVNVGSEKLLPGEVDAHVAGGRARDLQVAVDAPADVKFPLRDFTKEFEVAMGPQRRMMEPKYLVTLSPLPGVPTESAINVDAAFKRQIAEAPPAIPAPLPPGTAAGNSLVAQPAPLPA